MCIYTHIYIYTHTHIYIYIPIHIYIYIMEYYSVIKNNEIMPFINNIDGPRDYHTKWRKSDKDK